MTAATGDRQSDLESPADEPTIALSLRQLAVVAAVVIVVLAVLIQGRRWRAR